MKYKLILLLAAVVFTYAALSYSEDKDWTEYKMEYSNDWKVLKDIITISPKIGDISSNYISLPNPNDKKGFRCSTDGKVARVDTDGSGSLRKEIKDKESFADYTIEYGDTRAAYRMRIWQKSSKSINNEAVYEWAYQRGCFMKGQAGGEQIILIDDNNNGVYDDFGEDAIVIGSGNKQAELLSAVIFIKGKFYEFKTEEDGKTIQLKEYKGQTAPVDVKSGLKFEKQKLERIILNNEDAYFNIPLLVKSYPIPLGEYKLFSASFGKRIKATAGDAVFKVETKEKDKPNILQWGAPFKLVAQPKCVKGGALVRITPPATFKAPERETKSLDCPFIKIDDLPKVYGSGGEEYYADPSFQDEMGYAFPDAAVGVFYVDIVPKDSDADPKKKAKPKVLNKIGYPLVDNWTQVDLSGLIQKTAPFWEPYQCPLYGFRGTVMVKVTVKSQIFGELVAEEEVEVTDK
ncbi:MAG: hypothetical protein HY762_09590 [Planctomycetes bacterium]|nr:hypothetical protein [Planctomycetota bacterium]